MNARNTKICYRIVMDDVVKKTGKTWRRREKEGERERERERETVIERAREREREKKQKKSTRRVNSGTTEHSAQRQHTHKKIFTFTPANKAENQSDTHGPITTNSCSRVS